MTILLFSTKPTLMKDLVQENWLYSETCIIIKLELNFFFLANIPSTYQMIKMFTKLPQIKKKHISGLNDFFRSNNM